MLKFAIFKFFQKTKQTKHACFGNGIGLVQFNRKMEVMYIFSSISINSDKTVRTER
jgi:hypothetical protein